VVQARARALYDALDEAELVAYLTARPAAFDLIVAADVLNYLGDLAPALAAMRAALAPGGCIAISVEAGDGAPVTLGEGLRYRHNPAAIRALLGAGLLAERRATLRQEHGAPVAGAIFVAGL
jgi:predicted TPR repeat methyltransferase